MLSVNFTNPYLQFISHNYIMVSSGKINPMLINKSATHKHLFNVFVVKGECFYQATGCSWKFKTDGKGYSNVTRHLISKHFASAITDFDSRCKSTSTASSSHEVRSMATYFKFKKHPPSFKKRDPEQLHFKNFVVQALVRPPYPFQSFPPSSSPLWSMRSPPS